LTERELTPGYENIVEVIQAIKSSKRDLTEFFNSILATHPLYKFIGLQIVEVREGYAKAILNKKSEILRRGEVVHGGVIATAIDTVIGIAVMTVNDGVDQYTVELKINFLNPLKVEPFIVIGKVIKKGKTLVFGEAEVFDGNNILCAKGIGTWFIVKE